MEIEPVEQIASDLESSPGQLKNALDLPQTIVPRIVKKAKLRSAPVRSAGLPAAADCEIWAALACAELDQRWARRNRIVAFAQSEPAYSSFGVLRTKILRSLKLNNWAAIAITSPEPGCGKSVLAVNLAFCFARLQNCRVALLDLDFRRPKISALLGLEAVRPTAAFLEGNTSIEEAFVRYGDNLAVSAGKDEIKFPAELLQSQSAQAAMMEVRERLGADVILLDMPPLLGSDDVLAFLPNADCTLLVIGAGLSTIAQVHRCEQELSGETNLLGMVLNKCLHEESSGYY